MLRRAADPQQMGSTPVNDLHRYWLSKHRDDAIPGRAQIDPTEIPHLLPNILLGSIEYHPFRVFYRLVGTRITAFRGALTGQYLDSVSWLEPETRSATQEIYEAVAQSRLPTFAELEVRSVSGTPYRIHTGLWPLAGQAYGPTDMFIAIEDYGDLERIELDF
ncbi:MAG TPA: PAS domain-containing protein [Dongiaceae bacterium]|nr:PAS domain-containing protein [Dongiaceae bacterium]